MTPLFRIMEYGSSVLTRASGIIDRLAAEPDQPWTLGDIARACDLPAATCHRLVNELVELGWVDQTRHRGVYRLGPRVWALTSGTGYRSHLMSSISPHIRDLADRLAIPIVVACRRGHRRHTLGVWHPHNGWSDARLIESDDLLTTSGGRLLLALAPGRAFGAILLTHFSFRSLPGRAS